MDETVHKGFSEHAALVNATVKHVGPKIPAAAETILAAYRNGHGVFLFGNGGSAADAQHIAAELVGRFLRERRALRAEALSVNTSVLTAVANDDGFERVFVRQLEANAQAGDVAFALSTSGNSPNVVAALKHARQSGLRTIALTGQGGGQCAPYADVLLDIPSTQTPRVQEVGMLVYHMVCELVEAALAD
ncbi:MAG: SIS domain-containing protein [Phycisphaerae bacterium]|nr:SIS domain-containing protein [Phycisphaerae bacterium]